LGGPAGVMDGRAVELDAAALLPFRHQGGFHLLKSGRDKIETKEDLAKGERVRRGRRATMCFLIGPPSANHHPPPPTPTPANPPSPPPPSPCLPSHRHRQRHGPRRLGRHRRGRLRHQRRLSGGSVCRGGVQVRRGLRAQDHRRRPGVPGHRAHVVRVRHGVQGERKRGEGGGEEEDVERALFLFWEGTNQPLGFSPPPHPPLPPFLC
jgi:hypothetical protein